MNLLSEPIEWMRNRFPKTDVDGCIEILKKKEIDKVRAFHEGFDQYSKTPLVDFKELADYIGVRGIYLKDESYRFELNAFKVLGSFFAIAKYMVDRLGKYIKDLGYKKLISNEIREKLGDMVFVTATDGNHGRGVAWAANQLKQKSVVYIQRAHLR